MALIRTSIPVPTEPWETAKARFLNGLADADVAIFRDATPENIFHGSSAAHKKHMADSRFMAFIQRMQPLTEALADIASALDVYANVSAMVLCPLWGSLRVLIHIAQGFGRYFEELVDMFARIGDTLPRFHVYQHLFPEHERLLSALTNVYLDLLRFRVDVKETFTKTSNSRRSLWLTFKSQWKPLKLKHDGYLTNFQVHNKQVEKEAVLSHMVEAKKARELEERQRTLSSKKKEQEEHCTLLSRLSVIDCKNFHRKLQSVRHANTGDWLLKESSCEQWLMSSSSSSFSLWGIPGSGKTILTSKLVDDLAQRSGLGGEKQCYFYCDYGDQETLDPSNIVGCLIRQLSEGTTDICEDITQELKRLFSSGLGYPVLDDLKSIFAKAIGIHSIVVLVIDGVDELAKNDQKALLKLINSLMSNRELVLKFMVSSRREEKDIRDALEWEHSVDLNLSNMSSDIDKYVRDCIETKILEGDLVLSDVSLKGEIIDALVSGAEDMYVSSIQLASQLWDLNLQTNAVKVSLGSFPDRRNI